MILNEGYLNNKNFFKKGLKSFVIGKKKFFDLSSASGCLILGHNNLVFKNSLKKIYNLNVSNFTSPNVYSKEFYLTLKKLYPQFYSFIFCTTGAEANLKALRICRALTNRDKVLSVSGSWHGSVDQFLFIKKKKLELISSGTGEFSRKNIIFLPFNNFIKTEKILIKIKKNVCAVFIEPVQAGLPIPESLKYFKFLYGLCKKYKIILVIDENITGLRFNGTSFQNNVKLYPEIAVFGKAFGNSFPISIIGVSKKIHLLIKKKYPKVFFGGTYSANSYSCLIANNTTKYLIENKKKIFSYLEKINKIFVRNISFFILKKNLDVRIYSFSNIIRIIFTSKNITNRNQRDFLEKINIKKIKKFKNFLLKKGIYYPSNGIIFLNYAMTIKDIQKTSLIICDGLLKYFKKKF